MPATTKPPGQRRRRSSTQPHWRQLPAAGRRGRAPALPRKTTGTWLKSTREWWQRAWKSPMAVAWLDADFDAVVRLAQMRDALTRDPTQVSLQAQATALEDRLGLTPKARRALQWEVAQADDDEDESREPAKVVRLRAVDPAAAAKG